MKLTKEEIQNVSCKGGIYLFTNLVNNKHYVGQAICLRKRLRSHLGNIIHNRYDNPLYRAINKYGIDNFDISIIELLDIEDKKLLRKTLDDLEVLYIEKYDSYKNGYNQTKGADGGILGYKMTDKQKQIISQNSKKEAWDGRYFVYSKNIETGEVNSGVNMIELASKLSLNVVGVRTAKAKKKLYKGKYIFAPSIEELNELENSINKVYHSEYDPTSSKDSFYLEYYNYLLTLDNPSIQQVADNLGLTKDTINKRNKKLKEFGYTLPESLSSRNKIKYIELIDTIDNSIEQVQIQDIADKFSIAVSSVRKQIKREGLYKKRYKFNIVYV